MARLSLCLQYYVHARMNNNSAWKGIKASSSLDSTECALDRRKCPLSHMFFLLCCWTVFSLFLFCILKWNDELYFDFVRWFFLTLMRQERENTKSWTTSGARDLCLTMIPTLNTAWLGPMVNDHWHSDKYIQSSFCLCLTALPPPKLLLNSK